MSDGSTTTCSRTSLPKCAAERGGQVGLLLLRSARWREVTCAISRSRRFAASADRSATRASIVRPARLEHGPLEQDERHVADLAVEQRCAAARACGRRRSAAVGQRGSAASARPSRIRSKRNSSSSTSSSWPAASAAASAASTASSSSASSRSRGCDQRELDAPSRPARARRRPAGAEQLVDDRDLRGDLERRVGQRAAQRPLRRSAATTTAYSCSESWARSPSVGSRSRRPDSDSRLGALHQPDCPDRRLTSSFAPTPAMKSSTSLRCRASGAASRARSARTASSPARRSRCAARGSSAGARSRSAPRRRPASRRPAPAPRCGPPRRSRPARPAPARAAGWRSRRVSASASVYSFSAASSRALAASASSNCLRIVSCRCVDHRGDPRARRTSPGCRG